MFSYTAFVKESWKIEGLAISDDDAIRLAGFHYGWCTANQVTVDSLTRAADYFTDGEGELRGAYGMDVRVGSHYPPLGGITIPYKLQEICQGTVDPFHRHRRFQDLHPFTDGNGRTGRLLWLRDMQQAGRNLSLGFLHTFYYQALGSTI